MKKKLFITLNLLTMLFILTNAQPAWQNVGNAGFNSEDAKIPSLAIDLNGTPYVAFKEGYFSGDSKLSVMKFDGNAWTYVGNAGFSDDEASDIDFVIDKNGTPYVAFSDFARNDKATVMKFDSGSWVVVGNAGFSSGTAYNLSLALDQNGTPFLAFVDENWTIQVMKFSNNNWISVSSSPFATGYSINPSLALDISGTPYVAYYETSSGKVAVKKMEQNNWVQLGNAAISTGYSNFPSLSISSVGTPHVAFVDQSLSNYPVFDDRATVMKFENDTWINVGNALFSDSNITEIDLALDVNGTAYVAFPEGNSGKTTVMKYNGATWVKVGAQGFSAGYSYSQSLALSTNGIPYVAFTDATQPYGKTTVMNFASVASTCAATATFKLDGLKSFWKNGGANDDAMFYHGVTQWKRVHAKVSGGVGPYTYVWSNSEGYTLKNQSGNQIQLFEPLGASYMICEITDQGASCTFKDSVFVDWTDEFYCGDESEYWKLAVCQGGVGSCMSWNDAKTVVKNGSATLGLCPLKTNPVANALTFDVELYPVPSNGMVYVKFTAEETRTVDLLVTDINGKVLMQNQYNTEVGQSEQTLDLSHLANGMYLVRFNTNENVITKKVQIMH